MYNSCFSLTLSVGSPISPKLNSCTYSWHLHSFGALHTKLLRYVAGPSPLLVKPLRPAYLPTMQGSARWFCCFSQFWRHSLSRLSWDGLHWAVPEISAHISDTSGGLIGKSRLRWDGQLKCLHVASQQEVSGCFLQGGSGLPQGVFKDQLLQMTRGSCQYFKILV